MKKLEILQKANQILQKPDINKQLPKSFFDFKPLEAKENIEFGDFVLPETRKKNSQKIFLSKVLAVIDLHKQKRFTDKITIIPLSCTNKKLLSIFGSSMEVSRAIDKMIACNLLKEYDSKYQFNANVEKYNKSKLYAYNYKVETQIKEYCKTNNINKYNISNVRNTDIVTVANTFEIDQVRFSSKLHLLKPDDMSHDKFEQYLTACLYKNYKYLEKYQRLADTINEVYFADDPDRRIQFTPTFTWNTGRKAVTKIGIRATNSLVSAKKEKEADDPEWIVYRADLLKKYGLNYEYDVKSSVPRVTYLMNNGIWLDDNIDLYEQIYHQFMNDPFAEFDKQTRDIFKSFHMRVYFDSEAKCAAHIKRAIAMKSENYRKDDWKTLDYAIRSYKKALTKVVGQQYDSEIFFHESCIYLKVLFELLTKNKANVMQIYDGFYTDKQINIQEIVSKQSEEYYREYNNITNTSNHNIVTVANTFATAYADISSLAEQALQQTVSLRQLMPIHIVKQREKERKEQLIWLQNYKKWRNEVYDYKEA